MWPQVITLSLAYFLVVTRPITSPSVISIFCRQKKILTLFDKTSRGKRGNKIKKKLKEKKSEEHEHLRHYQKTTTILLKRKRDGNVY